METGQAKMTTQNRTAPFLGRGISRPVRFNPSTGGLQMSAGSFDAVSVGLAFVPDQLTITGTDYYRGNKLREAMAHILATEVGEYDFLPEFGSRPSAIIHDPNNLYSRIEYETWAELATARWEKRVRIKAPEDFQWLGDDATLDRGEAPVSINPKIIPAQQPGNLVAPYVTPRQARNQEYPLGAVDSEGHDWTSRYMNADTYPFLDGKMLRARKTLPLEPQPDDEWHTTVHGDNWLRISSTIYSGEVRFWWAVADTWTYDAAQNGLSRREGLKVTEQLTPGMLMRAPSKARILTQMAA